MDLKIEFVGSDARTRFNRDEFLSEIDAEVSKLASQVSDATVEKNEKEAPDGAQGAEELILWLIQFGSSPEMIPAYLRAFAAAINEICRSKSQPSHIAENDEVSEEKTELDLKPKDYLLSLKAAGKAITLPATASALKKFVSEISQG